MLNLCRTITCVVDRAPNVPPPSQQRPTLYVPLFVVTLTPQAPEMVYS